MNTSVGNATTTLNSWCAHLSRRPSALSVRVDVSAASSLCLAQQGPARTIVSQQSDRAAHPAPLQAAQGAIGKRPSHVRLNRFPNDLAVVIHKTGVKPYQLNMPFL